MNRVQQWTAEQVGDISQFRGVPQGSAQQIGDVRQLLEETVKVVNTALQERISERSEAIKVPKISRQGSATESELTESSGEFHEVAKSSLDARPPGMQSRVPRQNSILQCLLVELGFLGPEQIAHPVPLLQQSQCLLAKLGLCVLHRLIRGSTVSSVFCSNNTCAFVSLAPAILCAGAPHPTLQ